MITTSLAVLILILFYTGNLMITSVIGAVSAYLVLQIGLTVCGARLLVPLSFWIVILWLLVF